MDLDPADTWANLPQLGGHGKILKGESQNPPPFVQSSTRNPIRTTIFLPISSLWLINGYSEIKNFYCTIRKNWRYLISSAALDKTITKERSVMRRFLLILFISVLPNAAYAACDPADLVGTYQVYATTFDSELDLATCTIKVLSSGFLKKGTACEDTLADGALDANLFVSRGKLSVTSQCRVKGFVVIGSDEGTERNDVLHATLSQDRSTLVGILTGSDGTLTQITGVRK